MDDTDDLLTISALSKFYKVDRRSIERRLANVKPIRVKRIGDRTYRFYRRAEVRALILAPNDADSLKAAFEELLAVRADILAMKRALKVREYITAEEYRREISNAFGVARGRILALPTKLADTISAAIQQHPKDKKARWAAVQGIWEADLDQLERELRRAFTWEDAN